MKAYPYETAREDQSTRTTVIVKSFEPLTQSDITRAINDPSLSRNGWSYVHPTLKKKWTCIEVYTPVDFATGDFLDTCTPADAYAGCESQGHR